jgi:hypothetical protein
LGIFCLTKRSFLNNIKLEKINFKLREVLMENQGETMTGQEAQEQEALPDLDGLLAEKKRLETQRAEELKAIKEAQAQGQGVDTAIRAYNGANSALHAQEAAISQAYQAYREAGWSIWQTGGGQAVVRFEKVPKGNMITFRVNEVMGGYDGLKPGSTFVNTQIETAPPWVQDAVQQGVFTFGGTRVVGSNGRTKEIPVPTEVYSEIPESE